MPTTEAQMAAIRKGVAEILTNDYTGGQRGLLAEFRSRNPGTRVTAPLIQRAIRELRKQGAAPFTVSAMHNGKKVTYTVPPVTRFQHLTTKAEVPWAGKDPITIHDALLRGLVQRRRPDELGLNISFGASKRVVGKLSRRMERTLGMEFNREAGAKERKPTGALRREMAAALGVAEGGAEALGAGTFTGKAFFEYFRNLGYSNYQITKTLSSLKSGPPFTIRVGKLEYRVPNKARMETLTKRLSTPEYPNEFLNVWQYLVRNLAQRKKTSVGGTMRLYGINDAAITYAMRHMERQTGRKFRRYGPGGFYRGSAVGRQPDWNEVSLNQEMIALLDHAHNDVQGKPGSMQEYVDRDLRARDSPFARRLGWEIKRMPGTGFTMPSKSFPQNLRVDYPPGHLVRAVAGLLRDPLYAGRWTNLTVEKGQWKIIRDAIRAHHRLKPRPRPR